MVSFFSLCLWFPRENGAMLLFALCSFNFWISSYILHSLLLNRTIWNCCFPDLFESSGCFWHLIESNESFIWSTHVSHTSILKLTPAMGQGVYSDISCFSLVIRGFVLFWLCVSLSALQIKIKYILWVYWFSDVVKQLSSLWYEKLIKDAPTAVS